MRLTGLFSGRETLVAQGEAINTIANNLANANTTGFKSQRTEFADLLAQGAGELYGEPLPSGNGVRTQDIRTLHFQQGAIEPTGRDLDLAIDGIGYFTVTRDGTDRFYTRAGNFNTDEDGNVVTVDGAQLLGFTEASPDAVVPLTVTGAGATPTATTIVTATGNLDNRTPIGAVPAAPTEPDPASSFATPIRIVDSTGAEHSVGLKFFHTGATDWTVQALVDGADVGGVAGTPTIIGTGTITFGPDGVQANASGANAAAPVATLTLNAAWSNGAAPGAATLDLSNLTGFAQNSGLATVVDDGERAGKIVGFSTDENGVLSAQLDTGDLVAIGTVALTTFPNPDGLEKVGENLFEQGPDTGDPAAGNPGTNSRGLIRGSSLESSTVDPASEFIDLIRYQRAYEAGSRVVTTVNQMLQTTIQMAT